MKIIVTEKINDIAIEMLKEHFEVDVRYGLDTKRDELLEVIENYDAIVVRSVTKVNEELFEKAKNLKVVGRAGNGTDNIDLDAATKYGIIVANTPDSNTMSACELTIGMLLAISRNIHTANKNLKAGIWNRTPLEGIEVYNKTLGIIGLGRIGSLVAVRMRAFGMRVLAYDPYITDERFKRFGVEKRENLEEMLQEADFITLHTPKTEETIDILSHKEFAAMKDGVRIVNAARGGIIDEAALLKALETKKVAAAGLDVHTIEPATADNPLFQFENVLVSPHIGASTVDAQVDVGRTIAIQVIHALKGEIVPNAVNLPTLHKDELLAVKPYIDLAEKLGKLYFQLEKLPIESATITYNGNLAKTDTEIITLGFLKGLLEPVVKENVNYVNAKLVAQKRGITVGEKKNLEQVNGHGDYITVKVRNKQGAVTLVGNLSSKREPRVIEINGYEFDADLTKYMLVIQNLDVPGVIGNLGKLLGEENINIATMQVGRDEKKEKAMMILSVDNKVLDENIEKINQVPNVILAKAVEL